MQADLDRVESARASDDSRQLSLKLSHSLSKNEPSFPTHTLDCFEHVVADKSSLGLEIIKPYCRTFGGISHISLPGAQVNHRLGDAPVAAGFRVWTRMYGDW
jgi:hypothetical protein